MKIIATILLLLTALTTQAWTVIGKEPNPETYQVQLGTFLKFESAGGAVRYFDADDETLCGVPMLLDEPSKTFNIQKEGLYKQYRSKSGATLYIPVSFADECTPPEPEYSVGFEGYLALDLSEGAKDAGTYNGNECTYIVVKPIKRFPDGRYLISRKIWDRSQYIDGQVVCPYK